MDEFLKQLQDYSPQLIATAGSMLAVLILKKVANKALSRSQVSSQALRLKWQVQLRNGSYLLLTIVLLLIWAPQLHSILISMLAVMVALVLATKELILCITGAVLKAASGSFTLGDRIHVGNWRGTVIDQGLLTTSLQEYPEGSTPSGNILCIPNSLFLSQAVVNEKKAGEYQLKRFSFQIKSEKFTDSLESELLKLIEAYCNPCLIKAIPQIDKSLPENIEEKHCRPQISLAQVSHEVIQLNLSCALATTDIASLEQKLLRHILEQGAISSKHNSNIAAQTTKGKKT